MTTRATRGRRLRSVAAGLIGGAIALTSLAGCSGGATETEGEVTGTLQVLVSSADGSDRAFEAVNAAFEDEYPDVTVEFSSVPNDAFLAARSSRITAGNLDVTLAAPKAVPDYVTNGSASDDSLAADAGLFLDLTDEDFVGNYTPSVMEALEYDDKTYTLPTGISYYTGVFYNKAIFEQNGLEIPTTWDEFQDVVSTLRDSGVTPLGIGGKDSWPAGLGMIAAVQSLYPSTEAKEQLAEDIWTGQTQLTDDTEVEVLERVKGLFDAADPNFAGIGYDAIPGAFAAGEVAMALDGTWNQTTIDAAVNGAFDYDYFPIPVSDDASDNATLGGKVELRLAAASNAPNEAAALAYLEFFSDPEVYAGFVETAGFAPAQPDIPAGDFLESLEAYTGTFSPAWDTLWTPNVDAGAAATFPFNYPGIAPLGTGTVEEAAQAAQNDWAIGG